ncbi:hypothetical protein LSH36_145g04058 [Paralvinella palmiformis]|uniref:Alpha/beta hydrolase fold-3 domain-containing protein n=1 Tax=Paralvinella palmiformis TaxID=53620 RepID=A0AAD9NA97_9ANNE|nr:hypothetical protein LSH36_145g04058 [Paralvinella palmiformis]
MEHGYFIPKNGTNMEQIRILKKLTYKKRRNCLESQLVPNHSKEQKGYMDSRPQSLNNRNTSSTHWVKKTVKCGPSNIPPMSRLLKAAHRHNVDTLIDMGPKNSTKMWSTRWMFVVILTVYISYKIRECSKPIPVGTSERFKLSLALLIRDVQFQIIDCLDCLGLVPDYRAIRWLRRADVQETAGVQRSDATFDGVPVRVYRPTIGPKPVKAMVFYHGGGWTLGSVDAYDPVTAYFAEEAAMLVISVKYRLVPEHDQGDGLADCVRATKHFLSRCDRYGIGRDKVVIAGDSAGGNIAAAVALRLRDEAFQPMPSLQLLIYPCLQAIDLELPSYQQNADGPFLTKSFMAWFLSFLCCKSKRFAPLFLGHGHVPSDVRAAMAKGVLSHDLLPNENKYPPYRKPDFRRGGSEIWERISQDYLDPYRFPLMAKDHRDLPRTYLVTAQFDILRDDGYLYVRKLKEDGVDVIHYNCPYCWHGIINGLGKFEYSAKIMDTMVIFLKNEL